MKTTISTKGRSMERGGIAGIIIALIIVVGVIVGTFIIAAICGESLNPFTALQGTEADRYADANAYPWQEGHLFIKKELDGYDMGGRRPPFRAQLKLTDTLVYDAVVYDNNNQYGQIKLHVFEDGDASAVWEGNFTVGHQNYKAVLEYEEGVSTASNSFQGNTAPLKIYQDETGRDRSKLYVITIGTYSLKETGKEEKIMGIGFVTAWIDKHYNAEGHLSIPSFVDGKMAIFNWGPVQPSDE